MLGNLTLYCVSNQARLFVPRQKGNLKRVPPFFASRTVTLVKGLSMALGPGRGGVWCKPEFALAATLGALVASTGVAGGSCRIGERGLPAHSVAEIFNRLPQASPLLRLVAAAEKIQGRVGVGRCVGEPRELRLVRHAPH